MVLTLALFYYGLMLPVLGTHQIPIRMDESQFWTLVLMTVLMGLGGYWINNLFDEHIDRINARPNPFSQGLISNRLGWLVYGAIILISVFCAFLLRGLSYSYLWSACIAHLALFWYSYQLKCVPLAGNLIISAFVGCVPLMIIWGELPHLQQWWQYPLTKTFFILLVTYALFAFLTNVLREIVKTLEDVKGDSARGCKTVTVEFGERSALVCAYTFLLLTGAVITLMISELDTLSSKMSLSVIVLNLIMVTFIGFLLYHKRWSSAQLTIKLFMVMGIFALLLY